MRIALSSKSTENPGSPVKLHPMAGNLSTLKKEVDVWNVTDTA